MGAELKELLPSPSSLAVTAAFALCLVVVARREEGYTWWKAVLVVVAGALTAHGTGLLVETIGPLWLLITAAVLSLFAVVAAIALGGRFWLQMTWRDALLVGLGYLLAQTGASFALTYFGSHAL